jgi:hypothetical protein
MKFVEPLGVYFADIAKDATLNGIPIKVIYDDEYVSGLGAFEGRNPQVHVEESLVTNVKHGDILKIGSVNYGVREVQPDGNGMVILQLRFA